MSKPDEETVRDLEAELLEISGENEDLYQISALEDFENWRALEKMLKDSINKTILALADIKMNDFLINHEKQAKVHNLYTRIEIIKEILDIPRQTSLKLEANNNLIGQIKNQIMKIKKNISTGRLSRY